MRRSWRPHLLRMSLRVGGAIRGSSTSRLLGNPWLRVAKKHRRGIGSGCVPLCLVGRCLRPLNNCVRKCFKCWYYVEYNRASITCDQLRQWEQTRTGRYCKSNNDR